MALSGYLMFGDRVDGDILNNLSTTGSVAVLARLALLFWKLPPLAFQPGAWRPYLGAVAATPPRALGTQPPSAAARMGHGARGTRGARRRHPPSLALAYPAAQPAL